MENLNFDDNGDLIKSNENSTYRESEYTASKLTLEDFARKVIFEHGGIIPWSRKLGISRGRASQILHGIDLPIKIDTITKIAATSNIKPMVLQQIFLNHKKGVPKNENE